MRLYVYSTHITLHSAFDRCERTLRPIICALISISFSSLTQTFKAITAGYHQNIRNRRSHSIEIIAEPGVHHSGNYPQR